MTQPFENMSQEELIAHAREAVKTEDKTSLEALAQFFETRFKAIQDSVKIKTTREMENTGIDDFIETTFIIAELHEVRALPEGNNLLKIIKYIGELGEFAYHYRETPNVMAEAREALKDLTGDKGDSFLRKVGEAGAFGLSLPELADHLSISFETASQWVGVLEHHDVVERPFNKQALNSEQLARLKDPIKRAYDDDTIRLGLRGQLLHGELGELSRQ